MTTLSIAQLYSNDPPKTFAGSVNNNTFQVVWAAVAGKKIRARSLVITGAFATDDLIEIAQASSVKWNFRWEDTPIIWPFPGEGWLTEIVNEAIQIRHQNGGAVILAVNILGREE